MDGYPTPVYIANHTLRVVPVPSGTQRIESVYKPLGFQVEVAISLPTITALLLIPLAVRIKRTRGSEQ
jgi:uncharacterized membrane protein YfhO